MNKNLIVFVFLMLLTACGRPNNTSEQSDVSFSSKYTSVEQSDTSADTPSAVTGKAAIWYEKAQAGNAEAQYELAYCLYCGLGVQVDYEKAIFWAKKASEQGYPAASYFVARCYDEGDGVDKNESEAKEWYIKAHEQALPLANEGDAAAQNVIGKLYLFGQGDVEINKEKALSWLKKSAEQDYNRAQVEIGIYYLNLEDNGAMQDFEQSLYWLRKAADKDNGLAQYLIGYCYFKGYGVQQDYAKAVLWYSKAAEQGLSFALGALGDCYLNGTGVPKDKTKGIELMRKAARQKNESAQKFLMDLGYSW